MGRRLAIRANGQRNIQTRYLSTSDLALKKKRVEDATRLRLSLSYAEWLDYLWGAVTPESLQMRWLTRPAQHVRKIAS